MAACGSLQQVFENPLPENQTLIESLSQWNQIKPVNPVKQSSFVEIFGELHFKEASPLSSSSFSSSLSSLIGTNMENNKSLSTNLFPETKNTEYKSCHKKSKSFSAMNSESLQMCTEGLGSESFEDMEDIKKDTNQDWQNQDFDKEITLEHNPMTEYRRSRTSVSTFPPPISCIGKSGKPWVCFKAYRQDGRFVLKEVRTPSQEVLQACREDGRLKLQFIQNDNIPETEEEEEDDDVDQELEGHEEEQHASIDDTGYSETTTDANKNEVEDDLQ